ncbi:MAG: hypothetical protein O7F71_09115 [Gammaproteobacteria bacterium]|nr:hypothetical protein [Gammaproteobacteria bacterium]
MPEILFLLGDVALAYNDNHERLPRAFQAEGFRVTELDHDSITLTKEGIRLGPHPQERFDLIWLVGFGRKSTFFDRMQLLGQLKQTRFVTEIDAFLHLHGKYRWLEHMPETHASNDVNVLVEVLEQGGTWVAKPSAGSFGRDVHFLAPGIDHRPILTQLTGGEMREFCLLQRYVAEIEQGETRTLVAGGKLIGSYLRKPRDGVANIALGAKAQTTTLNAQEEALVRTIAEDLLAQGVGFAAVDIAYPYLMEVNVANPGGLGTLETLTGDDLSPAVAQAIIAWRTGSTSGETEGQVRT